MGHKKLRSINTETDNLISNLRGEVAEIIATWMVMRRFMATGARLRSDDVAKDFENSDLTLVYLLKDKFEDEIVARLSELAEEKVGRLNFYFAAEKLQKLQVEVSNFSNYIKKNGFREKRNHDISHKELPEKWSDHRAPLHIPYHIIVRAVAHALRLMKRFDRDVLGPSAPYLWREARKRRYKSILSPPRVEYMLVPYYHLSGADRIRIVDEELREERQVWSEMLTTINGEPAKILACRKWGVLMLEGQPFALDQYPLQALTSIQIGPPEGTKPFYEQHTINAKYRCRYASGDNLSFEPVQRQHVFADGRATELVDIGINLNDEIRKNMGVVNVGDVKDFTLNVQILAGYEVSAGTKREYGTSG